MTEKWEMAIETSIQELQTIIRNLRTDAADISDDDKVLIPIVNLTGYADDWKFKQVKP